MRLSFKTHEMEWIENALADFSHDKEMLETRRIRLKEKYEFYVETYGSTEFYFLEWASALTPLIWEPIYRYGADISGDAHSLEMEKLQLEEERREFEAEKEDFERRLELLKDNGKLDKIMKVSTKLEKQFRRKKRKYQDTQREFIDYLNDVNSGGRAPISVPTLKRRKSFNLKDIFRVDDFDYIGNGVKIPEIKSDIDTNVDIKLSLPKPKIRRPKIKLLNLPKLSESPIYMEEEDLIFYTRMRDEDSRNIFIDNEEIAEASLRAIFIILIFYYEEFETFRTAFNSTQPNFIELFSFVQTMIIYYRAPVPTMEKPYIIHKDIKNLNEEQYKTSIINVLSEWVKVQYTEFMRCDRTKELWETFVQYLNDTEEEEYAKKLDGTIKDCEYRKLLKHDHLITTKKEDNPPHLDILSFDPDVIAEQLSLIDQHEFHKIELPDLCFGRWLGEYGYKQAPGLYDYIDRSNTIVFWIVSSIVFDVKSTIKERSLILSLWINVCDELWRINNLNSAVYIFVALNTGVIQKLKKTWGDITKEDRDLWKLLESRLSPESNFRESRLKWDSIESDIGGLPRIDMLVRDIIFMDEAPNISEDNKSVLNTSKMYTLHKVYKNVIDKKIYNFPEDSTFIQFFYHKKIMTEEELYTIADILCLQKEKTTARISSRGSPGRNRRRTSVSSTSSGVHFLTDDEDEESETVYGNKSPSRAKGKANSESDFFASEKSRSDKYKMKESKKKGKDRKKKLKKWGKNRHSRNKSKSGGSKSFSTMDMLPEKFSDLNLNSMQYKFFEDFLRTQYIDHELAFYRDIMHIESRSGIYFK
eukprot:TRINITY_DN7377_c0_g1_i2.p1 TRINITY_DN7377_c0_g1~~TRINITY_DN7377_c0_g1_i2.p1  ORF type:complete len:813 (-),score=176.09 TRINITY_DN7377_c0_g1_i2:288-2726(-)